MLGHIHLGDVYAQAARHFVGGKLFDDMQKKELVLLGVGAALHLFQSSVNQVLFPLLIPH